MCGLGLGVSMMAGTATASCVLKNPDLVILNVASLVKSLLRSGNCGSQFCKLAVCGTSPHLVHSWRQLPVRRRQLGPLLPPSLAGSPGFYPVNSKAKIPKTQPAAQSLIYRRCLLQLPRHPCAWAAGSLWEGLPGLRGMSDAVCWGPILVLVPHVLP